MKRSVWRRVRRHDQGTTSVEFALIGTVMFMTMFGTVELGRALWTWELVQAVASDTARCIGLGSSTCSSGAATYAVGTAGPNRGLQSLTSAMVSANTNATCGSQAGLTQVTISYTFNSPVARLIPGLSNGITLVGVACFPNSS